MSFNTHLTVHEIEQVPHRKLQQLNISSLNLKIKWIGDGKKHGFLGKRFKRSCTSKQQIQDNGTVRWSEEFKHVVDLKRDNSESFRSWEINLQVRGVDQRMRGKELIFAEAKIDITEYFPAESGMNLRIPLNFKIGDQSSVAILQVKLQTSELRSEKRSLLNLARTFSLRSFSLNQRHSNTENPRRNQRGSTSVEDVFFATRSNNNQLFADSSPDDEPEFDYKKLKTTNILLHGQYACDTEELKDGREMNHQKLPVNNYKEETPLLRFFSWNEARLSFRKSFKKINISGGVPLLNKACGELGGDDIDSERRCLGYSKRSKVHHEEKGKETGFEDEDQFEIGKWEKKRVLSRNGEMELSTDTFFASIDQRSEKADGGSACTVLAVIIADWMHRNPNSLPLRCQYDQIIREGSSEWRKLCKDDNYKENFSDRHFDLNTIIRAKIRPIMEIVDNSLVGFFGLDDIEYLREVRPFDSIWNELLHSNEFEERLYITSWNDHFFVLKMEKGAIYLIDTLGERLYEGCNQAYILKFSEASVIYRKKHSSGSQKEESNGETNDVESRGLREEIGSPVEIICEGMECCKEYIKGFLAAIPLRGLQEDIRKGFKEENTIHKRLQIEFHYIAPCTNKSAAGA